MTVDATSELEAEGSNILVAIATWNETDSAYDRTVLALATKEDTSVTIDEDTEDFNVGGDRRTKRYRTNNEITIEVTQAVATDLSALAELGIADKDATDGVKVNFSTEDRRIGFEDSNPSALEIGIFKDSVLDEAANDNIDMIADSELLHRAEGVKIMAGDVDPSATPETVEFEGMVEGDFWLDYDGSGSP